MPLMQVCLVDGAELKVKRFTPVRPGKVLELWRAGSGGMARLERCGMSKLCEVRSLMTEALRLANDVDQEAPPELHTGLEQIRDLLDFRARRGDGPGSALARDWPRGPDQLK